MELQQYIQIVKRYWRSALATFLACIALAAIWTLVQKPVYSSEASLYLSVDSGGTPGELSQGATYAERQVKSFIAVAKTSAVLQPVIADLGLDATPNELASRVTVTSPTATSIIDISVSDEDPVQAAAIANAVSGSLAEKVLELVPPGPDGNRLVLATEIEPALPSASPTSPRPAMNLVLGALLGALLGVGQALVRQLLDTRLRTSDDVEDVTDAPVLGVIGHTDETPARATDAQGTHWANQEAYRRLRTNVGFLGLGGERRPSIVMTSSIEAEGKTQTAIQLARVMAQAGESVLLVDADLRRPQVAARLGVDSEFGLSDVLTSRGSFEEAVIDVYPGYFAVLPAGTVPPNPSELLGSDAMSHLLSALERRYDHVIFDAPPLLPVTDSVVLASQTGGAIMVARSGKVKRPEFEAAQELLEAGSVSLLGVVLNDVPARISGYGSYYAEYGSHGKKVPTKA